MQRSTKTRFAQLATLAALVGVLPLASARPALASNPPPGAQVFSPPASIATDCSKDVTKPLYDWINTLPQGTTSQPTDVQFSSGGCYQVDGMLFLRGLTDFVFDGQGSTFRQSKVVDGELSNDLPPNRPAFCGYNSKYTTSAGTLPTGFDIMWFVEGGCNLVFENMDIVGTNLKAKPGGAKEQDSAIEVAGSQRVLVTNDQIGGVWGDFVTVTGLHEASFGGLNFPSFDVTVTKNFFQRSGRQGIAIVYADRVGITQNTIKNVAASAIDIEAEVGGSIEGNIDIDGNTFAGYTYLLSANTYAQLFSFAFTNNSYTYTKFVLSSNTKFPGHDFTIGSNKSSQITDWPNVYDMLLSNEATGLVTANQAKLAPPTPDFVSAGNGSGLISVQHNILDTRRRSRHNFLPDPLVASASTVATGCDNASSTGTPLDSRETPSTLAQCVTISPVQPVAAQLPAYLSSQGPSAAARLRATPLASANPTGSQPGEVSCSSLSGSVSFNPPLINGGSSPEIVLAQVTLSGCVGADGAGSPDTGYGTVSLVTDSNDCSSLEAGGAQIATPLTVGWSPTTLGTSSISFPGFSLSSGASAGFSLGGTGTAASGSYTGQDAGASTSVSATAGDAPADIFAACSSADGLSGLTISGGTLTVG